MNRIHADRGASGSLLPLYPGWLVVFACFWIAAFSWGIGFYGHGVYLAELAKRGWSTSLLSVAVTVYYLLGAVLMTMAGAAIERFGARRVALSGIASLSLALALLPLTTVPWQVFAVYALMAPGWAATSWAAIPAILARWFERQRGLAISLALTGASVGGIVATPLLIELSGRYGFAVAAWSFALLAFVAGGLLALAFLRRGPEALGLAIDGAERAPDRPRPPASERDGRRSPSVQRQALRSPRFWSTAIAFSLALAAQVGFLTHQVGALSVLLGVQGAGLAVAVTTAASVVGRLALGFVIDRMEPRIVSAAAFFLQAVALLLLAETGLPWLIFVACALFGVWVGNIVTLPSLVVQRDVGGAAFAPVVGLVTSISQFSFALGPAALGFLHDAGGSYAPVLALCAVLDLAAAAAILLPRYRTHRASAAAIMLRDDPRS